MTHIILCGGSGTRLWPLSRTLMPKQFIPLFDGESLFQLTAKRNVSECDVQYVVANTEHYFLAQDQLDELGMQEVGYLLEPVGKNTAAAIALAALAHDPEEILLVTPSDHLIKDIEAYHTVLKRAEVLAKEGYIVTFGIVPEYAETGYGYIEAEGERVDAFHEKPQKEQAEAYLKEGNYYWNSGMFCFRAEVILQQLHRYAPDIHEACVRAYDNARKDGMVRIRKEDMEQIPSQSIDYAVMEHSSLVRMVVADIGWSDLGSFDALAEEKGVDANGNLILSERCVKTVDIKDTIIADTGDALLLAKRGSTQKVKEVVEALKAQGSQLPDVHLTGYRPWGSYTILKEAPGYKIKYIEVKPGRRLSLQKHYHRNEHWIVLSGCATVTVNDSTFTVNPNESTYIKAGDIHRLENRGKLPLVIIEVQVGEYTGEDDIVRIEDDYQRIEV